MNTRMYTYDLYYRSLNNILNGQILFTGWGISITVGSNTPPPPVNLLFHALQ